MNKHQYLLYFIYNLFILLILNIVMVKIMNDKIKQDNIEFEKKNYQNALNCLNQVHKNEYGYKFSLIVKLDSFMRLKKYDEALKIIDLIIEESPHIEIFWAEKVRCHLFLNEDAKALDALKELEKLCGDEDKEGFVRIARFYSILNENDKVIENCDNALKVDENYLPALYEKMLATSFLKDEKMIDDISEYILNASDNDLLSMLPVIMINLFSENYEKALELIENCELGEIDEEHRQLLKGAVYKRICDDLNAQIMLSEKVDLDVRDAVRLMLEFKETGKDHGEFNGVEYYIF